jgi:mRNA interferase RelE/StbE
MPEYSITSARSARKELEKLPQASAQRVIEKIETLSSTPRPAGSLKLKGARQAWRIRIGEYRVIYEIDDRQRSIDAAIVRHRKDVYRDL